MNIDDLFDDDVFPDLFDKHVIRDDMENAKNNEPLISDRDGSTLAKLFLLFDYAIINGRYDGKYLYVVSGLNSIDDVYYPLISILDDHNIRWIGSGGSKIELPKTNSEIKIATFADVENGAYEFYDANVVMVGLNYSHETVESLTNIQPHLNKCLAFGGKIAGFLSDFSKLSSSKKQNERIGEFRMDPNSGLLQVYSGSGWINLKP